MSKNSPNEQDIKDAEELLTICNKCGARIDVEDIVAEADAVFLSGTRKIPCNYCGVKHIYRFKLEYMKNSLHVIITKLG